MRSITQEDVRRALEKKSATTRPLSDNDAFVQFHDIEKDPKKNEHLARVLDKMKTMGSPTVRVLQGGDGRLYAIEGNHRMVAAGILGLTPNVKIYDPVSDAKKTITLDWDKWHEKKKINDIAKHMGLDKDIEFPYEETEAYKDTLSRNGHAYTTRTDNEMGKYTAGFTLTSPLGKITIEDVKRLTGRHPFDSELTDEQRKYLADKEYDLIRFKKVTP